MATDLLLRQALMLQSDITGEKERSNDSAARPPVGSRPLQVKTANSVRLRSPNSSGSPWTPRWMNIPRLLAVQLVPQHRIMAK